MTSRQVKSRDLYEYRGEPAGINGMNHIMNQSQQLIIIARIVFRVEDIDPLPEGWKRDLSELVYGPSRGMLRMMQRVAAGAETLPPDFQAKLLHALYEEAQANMSAHQKLSQMEF